MLLQHEKRPVRHGPDAARDPLVSPEHELVLAMIGTGHRRKVLEPRALELLDHVDCESLASVLEWQSLLPLVGTRLEHLAPEKLPASFRDRVDRSVRDVSRVATLHAAVTLRAVSALDGAGIRGVPLKGAMLAENVFDHVGLRQSSDIDLLVDRHDLERALKTLEAEGWRLENPEPPGELPLLHYVLEHRTAGFPRLELHWRIHWYETGFSAEFVARSTSSPGRGRRASLPDELAALLLFHCRDGFIGLRYAADLAAWWDANGSALEPNALDPILRAHPELAGALLTTLQVAETTVGVPRRRLTSFPPPHSVRADMAQRLADWAIDRSLDQAAANRTLVDGLLSPRGGQGAFVRRTLLPSRATIRDLYGLDPDARLTALLWQGAHGPKLLLRYLVAMWAIRGDRRWKPMPAWAPKRAA